MNMEWRISNFMTHTMTWPWHDSCFKFYQVDILIHLNDSFIIMCSPEIYDINISLQAVHFVKDFNFGN